ncbi:nitric oxide synthase [Desulfonema ishimotonii]|uniref:Nitric oxide synthase n=1 Tax=Desulfonema ishimotonii TaxID=45657 RepID=A0A401FQ96_9BACT|nr:flavodoxin domain-containing protein [Desulfonema ishimotonii]GBC59151.1 nitric oxide synthase [Desulfonema ishimotonii]
MKISIDKNLVEFVPENADETANLEILWNTIVDCMKFNKKLVPIGEYIPQKRNLARFAIEGEPGETVISSETPASEKTAPLPKKVLIACVSRTGNTEKMAEFIAEGVRFTGAEAVVKKVSAIKSEKDVGGYGGYIFGCPTYHRDMTASMKTFLFLAEKAGLNSKPGGAFSSYTHSGEAGPMVFDTMQYAFKMDMVGLGALNLKEDIIRTGEGIRACQDYGKSVGQKLAD